MKSDPRPLRSSWLLSYAAILCLLFGGKALAQSNYVQHGDSGNYSTNGLPEEATLDGKVSATLLSLDYRQANVQICEV